MKHRDRTPALEALLLRAGWGRDAAAAAHASASRDAAAADATLRAIETTLARALDGVRAATATRLDAAAMQRGVASLAAIERSLRLAAKRCDETATLATRRREASRVAQSSVDALARRRDDDALATRRDAERRAADEVDRQWLARRATDDNHEETR